MERTVKPLAIANVIYCALMVVLGWVAVGTHGFESQLTASIAAATIGLLIALVGYRRRGMWLITGGCLAVQLLAPSPLGIWPGFIGIGLALTFALIATKAAELNDGQPW
ncbi:hypothetical protein I6E29_07670 [Arcanobacterium haemolyticum]|nr:hypothetical protein [Arcanobacterium haemolyticum]